MIVVADTSPILHLARMVVADPVLSDLGLDPGETAAMLLAEQISADALLIDERRGRAVAAERGIAVIGTLGIVAGARRIGLIDRVAPLLENSGPMDSGCRMRSLKNF